VKPFVRWAGGKRAIAAQLAKEIEDVNPRLYVEPFVGGGAVALAVPSYIPKLLSDVNTTLIDAWRCLKKAPIALIDELHRIEDQYGNASEGYLKARDEMNGIITNPRPLWIRRAALFLYLNARCFNGLWRANASSKFNVPFGKLEKPSSIDHIEAQALSKFLRNVTLESCDFTEICSSVANKAPAVFFDSPYDEGFEGYAADGFGEHDQRRLAEWFFYLVRCGAKVWATNRDTPLIRELYVNAKIEPVEERHIVGATGERRGARSCVLIRGGL
jgi:DNA adenine methylase